MVIISLVVAFAFMSGWLICRNVALRDSDMREAQGRVRLDLRIYEDAQHGDLRAVQDHLGMLILGQVRDYEQQYGVPLGTNSFAQKFATVQAIAKQVESNLVWVK
jgi:hypothetical protein